LTAAAIYIHPLYLAAVVINVVVIVLAWGRVGTSPLAQ